MISITKKLLSVALAVVLLLGAFPATVLADGAEEVAPAATQTWSVSYYDAAGNLIRQDTVNDGDMVNLPTEAEAKAPAGKQLDHWETRNGKVINPGHVVHGNCNIVPILKDVVLANYTVSFNINCTDVATPAPIVVTQNGTYNNLPALNRPGYNGVWKNENGDTVANNSTVLNKDHVLTAEWTPCVYTVKFYRDDNSLLDTKTVAHGQKITNAPALSSAITQSGKQPTGWTYDLTQPVTSNLDIRPLYKANTYTITFDPVDSSIPGSEKLAKRARSVTYGEKIGAMEQYDLTDYVLVGWEYDGTEYTANTTYMIEGDITLHAIWERQAIVEIHIYRNGKTASAYGEPIVFNLPVGATLNLKNVDIRDYYTGSKNFKFEGYFDMVGWRAYKAGENPKAIEQVKTIDPRQGIVELYCMVTDNDAVAPTPKPTTKPADPHNPQTGDESMILATTTAMLISAGALMLIVYDRKRRNA